VDAVTKTVLLTVVLSIVIFGFIVFLTANDISQAKIPDVEQGTVLSKQVLSNSTNYSVTLSDGKTLYVQNNSSLFESIQENHTYVFNCRIDLNNEITIIDKISEK
jgi:hypothetical protein